MTLLYWLGMSAPSLNHKIWELGRDICKDILVICMNDDKVNSYEESWKQLQFSSSKSFYFTKLNR